MVEGGISSHPSVSLADPGTIERVAEDRNIDDRRLVRALTRFRGGSDARAWIELALTVVPFFGLWVSAMMLVRADVALGLALTIPAGGLLLRLFLIQHDCGHGSFLRRQRANMWVGRLLSVLTLTPYDDWRRSHALHHASTGNLDRRGFGDIDTMTLAEYRALPVAKRVSYRLYRNPLVLFGIGPAYQFLLRHRMPAGFARRGWRPWVGVMATNLAIAALFGGAIGFVGLVPFVAVHLPVTLVAATAGVWLFYVQHQFPHTTWARGEQWCFREAGLRGSSFYDLPPVLRWFTANIGVHHVHHLCSAIPFYRLQDVLKAFPELATRGRLGMRESLGTVRLALWNEKAGRMISFNEARHA